MLDLRLMPLFSIEHPVISLDPNSHESNATKEVPNLHFLGEFLWDHLPKGGLFLVETIIIACPHPAKFTHNEGFTSPCSLDLIVIPILKFNQFICVKESKKHIA